MATRAITRDTQTTSCDRSSTGCLTIPRSTHTSSSTTFRASRTCGGSRSSYQSDPSRVRDGGRLSRDVELQSNVREVPMRRVRADEQLVRDLSLAQALSDQAQH